MTVRSDPQPAEAQAEGRPAGTVTTGEPGTVTSKEPPPTEPGTVTSEGRGTVTTAEPTPLSPASGPVATSARSSDGDEARTIEMENVSRVFGNVVAVRNLDLAVEPGTILGVIGPSGSGKTTTIRMLAGLLKPSSGTVRVLGEEPRRFRRRTRERIGYMPQGVLLYPELTTMENVDFMASLFGLLFWRRRRRVREVLKLLDLWPVRGRQARALSGGMQRRLELACAIVHDPVLLFLDEPTVGLDPLLRRSIWRELHRLRDAGRTLIVTTQYVSEAEECDTVALLSNGRLLALESPAGLRRLALGGDVVELETDRIVDASSLPAAAASSSLRQLGPRSLLAVSPDGASATPALVNAIEDTGARVVSVREYRPSFDDLFAMLVQRGESMQAEAAASQDQERS
jgi:ABC-2 type transport system ATP-binding protein